MAHCFPAAGKWRRESKNPRRKRGKPVDFSSNPGTGLAWKSVQAILKGAVYPRERPRNLARERVEEELSFRKVFYFSADIYALFSPFYISLPVPTRNLDFLSNLEIHQIDSTSRFIKLTHKVHGESSKRRIRSKKYDEFWNNIRTTDRKKRFRNRALRVSFAYPVYAVALCAVDDSAVANNERTYRESETKNEYQAKFLTW